MEDLEDKLKFVINSIPEVRRVGQAALSAELRDIKQKMIAASPVLSGKFKSSWSVRKSSIKTSTTTILNTGIVIENKTDYASAIEEGISPSSMHPWATSMSAGNPGGGLVMSNGLIWSRKAIGGVESAVFPISVQAKVADSVTLAIAKVFE